MASVRMQADCLNEKGKMSKCFVENNDGNLIIEYKKKKEFHLNKTIPGDNVTRITGGEYAKRRVGTAVALGILLTPLALFTLFSKKKIENFGIEFTNANGQPDATLIQVKKKNSWGMKALLQSATAKEIEYPEPEPSKKKKKDK